LEFFIESQPGNSINLLDGIATPLRSIFQTPDEMSLTLTANGVSPYADLTTTLLVISA
jgi:hypothetical protein